MTKFIVSYGDAPKNKTYYHGTLDINLSSILTVGLQLTSPRYWKQSSSVGRSNLIYLTTTPEMALWWATQSAIKYYRNVKRRSAAQSLLLSKRHTYTVLKVSVNKEHIIKDSGSLAASDFAYGMSIPKKDIEVYKQYEYAEFLEIWKKYRGVGREIEWYDEDS